MIVLLVVVLVIVAALAGVVAYDVTQRKHAILRTYPIIGHLRFLLEAFGPELRQYIVTSNDEERPFSRDQRRWVYASSKHQDNRFGFGTDNDLEHTPGYLVIKHAAFPHAALGPGQIDPTGPVPAAKVLGAAHRRRAAFRPSSIVNISGMSFGSLSGPAIESLNAGAAIAGCLHNTGEGGVSPHHLHGGDLVWQIGTGYFGCRDDQGDFDLDRLVDQAAAMPVRAIEIKLSQGAKPGLGGLLPAAKITPEIAAIRGIAPDRDCISPPYHRAFRDVPSMVELIERIADATGLPVGIKSAVGENRFWVELADHMAAEGTGPDFITIDGGEGGTGAAPLVFADHVSLPFKVGFPRVYSTFAERGLQDGIVFVGSGKLGLPENGLLALALGCDTVSVGREAMLAIGCVQAQRCHTGRCPSGVATQSAWRARGLDPELKSVRVANYVITLRAELLRLAHAAGAAHPALVPTDQLEVLTEEFAAVTVRDRFGYEPEWALPPEDQQAEVVALMAATQEPDHSGRTTRRVGTDPAPLDHEP